MEKRIACSTCLIVLLTTDCLRQLEVIFAMSVAKRYYKEISRVILVHDAGNCLFPAYADCPPTLTDFLSEAVVTFFKCYINEGVQEILEKYQSITNPSKNEEKNEDLTTRVFLSHTNSGEGIAGRLYDGLKESYKVFMYSEAKFKVQNLKKIVQQTEVLILILSPGILQNRWCCDELETAIQNRKMIIIVRDLSYTLPDQLLERWNNYQALLKSKDQLIWMAKYNTACIEKLKKIIGQPDYLFYSAKYNK